MDKQSLKKMKPLSGGGKNRLLPPFMCWNLTKNKILNSWFIDYCGCLMHFFRCAVKP